MFGSFVARTIVAEEIPIARILGCSCNLAGQKAGGSTVRMRFEEYNATNVQFACLGLD